MENDDFEMVRHIAAKAVVEDDRVDVEELDADDMENPMILAAHDAANGTYLSID